MSRPTHLLRSLVILSGVCAALAPANSVADDAAAAPQQRQMLDARIAKDNRALHDIRQELAKSPDLADSAKALADAKKAMQDKIASDPKIVAAQKAADDAVKASRDIADSAVAASPDVAEAQKNDSTADDALYDLQSQLRIDEFTLTEMRHKVARDPDLKKLFDAMHDADTAYHHALTADKTSTATADAKTARDAAQKAYNDALDAKVAANPDAVAMQKKIADLEQSVKDAQANLKAADQKLRDARDKAIHADTKAADAHKAAMAAQGDLRKVSNEALTAEQAAVTAAQKDYNDKLEAKVEADSRGGPLKKELDDLVKQSHELAGPAHNKPAKTSGTRPATQPASAPQAPATKP